MLILRLGCDREERRYIRIRYQIALKIRISKFQRGEVLWRIHCECDRKGVIFEDSKNDLI